MPLLRVLEPLVWTWPMVALLLIFFFFFLGLHLRHMEVPRRGVKSELPL